MGTVPVRLPGLADVTRPLRRLLEYPEHVHVLFPFVLSYSPHPRHPLPLPFVIFRLFTAYNSILGENRPCSTMILAQTWQSVIYFGRKSRYGGLPL